MFFSSMILCSNKAAIDYNAAAAMQQEGCRKTELEFGYYHF